MKHIGLLPDKLLINKARELACTYHKNLYGDKPYMYHLDQVVLKLIQLGYGDHRYLCAGYMHDLFEDTEVPRIIVSEDFGHEIYNAIVFLTKEEGYDYGEYIDGIKTNHIAYAVKIADTLCNLEESFRTENKRFIQKYSNQIKLLSGDVV